MGRGQRLAVTTLRRASLPLGFESQGSTERNEAEGDEKRDNVPLPSYTNGSSDRRWGIQSARSGDCVTIA